VPQPAALVQSLSEAGLAARILRATTCSFALHRARPQSTTFFFVAGAHEVKAILLQGQSYVDLCPHLVAVVMKPKESLTIACLNELIFEACRQITATVPIDPAPRLRRTLDDNKIHQRLHRRMWRGRDTIDFCKFVFTKKECMQKAPLYKLLSHLRSTPGGEAWYAPCST